MADSFILAAGLGGMPAAHGMRAAPGPQHRVAMVNAVCRADRGDTGSAFVARPRIPPRNVNGFKKGKGVHRARIAFEKSFMRKMRTGNLEPVYEKYVLKALGIVRLATPAQ